MKSLINISILLFLLNDQSFPQFCADSLTPNYVIEFMKIADETTNSIDSLYKVRKEFTDEELKYITGLYYQCYDESPASFYDYLSEKHKKWVQIRKFADSRSEVAMPWSKVYILKDQLSKKYGYKFINIISIPAFIRGKFVDLKYQLEEKYHNYEIHNFIFLVEEVLKGNKYFSVGDTVSILMIPNIESPAPIFVTGKSYLIPVTILLGHQDDGFNTIFEYLRDQQNGWEMGKPPKTFLIENEIIKNCDYFGIQDTSWTDFKKYFKETFMIFD
jgi:hypothetical protein